MINKPSVVLFLALCILVNCCMVSNLHADTVLEGALALIDQENYAEAALQLEPLLQTSIQELNVNSEEIHHVLAHCYEKQEKWNEAVQHYQKAVAPANELADYALFRLAKAYHQMGDYPSALIWYQRLIDEYPRSFHFGEANFEIAKVYQQQNDYEKALDSLSNLIDNKGSGYVRQSLYERGLVYEALGKRKQALLTYQQLTNADPTDEVAKNALDRIKKLVKAHPNYKISRTQRMNQGLVLYHHSNWAGARAEFERVAAGYKDSLAGRATYYVGRSYYRQRRYDSAIKAFNKVGSLYPESGYLTRALYQTTLCYRRSEQPDMAQKRLKAFLEQYAWSALADDAHYDLGWVQQNQEQYDEAIATYRRMTQKYRSSDLVSQAYWRIGWIQFKKKRYAECIETFAALLEQYPDSAFSTAAHFWIAKSHERQNQWEAAEKVYRENVAANHWYYADRARAILKNGPQGGVVSLNTTESRANVAPNNSVWKDIGSKKTPRAAKLMQLRLYEDALTELKGTIRVDRSNLQDSYYNLIVCYQKLKEFQKAIIYADKLASFEMLQDENEAIPIELYQLRYPLYYGEIIQRHSQAYEIDPLFVASMIREESRYNADIASWAGALGLMQIMPATGQDLARRLRIRHFRTAMLLNPEINIQMGTWYMKHLMDKFENNHALVAGAYNGGPGRIQRWLNEMDVSDFDEFIEDISITETRRHIKKVIDSYRIYKELYSEHNLPAAPPKIIGDKG